VFVSRMNDQTAKWSSLSGEGLSLDAQRALLIGSQYSWHRRSLNENVAVLWSTDINCDSAVGASGSVLCLGQTCDSTAKAVAFQNFQTALTKEAVSLDFNTSITSGPAAIVKGAFLLPPDILDAEILVERPAERTEIPICTWRSRQSAERQKRVFIGPA
jgi:hypothetical protein